jgi:fructose-1,6-bisphosphatase I
MIEVFNAISNIAVQIEKDVFQSCTDFLDVSKSDEEIHQDVYEHCRRIIESEFEKVKSVKGAIGKEKKQLCTINREGKYLVSYVAVDNIELLDVDFSLGSMFAIYENELTAHALKASVYITYGPTFQVVFASKAEGVKFFSYKNGELIQKDSFQLESKGKINSTAGIQAEWSLEHKALIKSFFDEGYRLRFSDSLTLDTHQILFKKGGIYSSPATISHPNGILELLFEAYPIAFIMELVNGEAIDGKQRILEIECQEYHQKTPIYFGSKAEIEKVRAFLK